MRFRTPKLMTYFGAVHTNNQWKMLIEKGSTQKDINAEVNATPTPVEAGVLS